MPVKYSKKKPAKKAAEKPAPAPPKVAPEVAVEWPDGRRWIRMPDGSEAYEYPTFAAKDKNGAAIVLTGGKYNCPPKE